MSTYGSRLGNGQPYYSQNKFEQDQKDLLISQLKAENFELRQNERDYQELAQHLKSLEHRYNLLHDEKVRSEVDFKSRNEFNLKTIANLRTELDNLKSTATEKHIESQEMRAESLAIKEIAEHRQSDIQRLKNELQQISENNRRYYEEKLKLETEVQQIKEEKRRLLHEQDMLNNNYEDLIDKLQERERLVNQISDEKDKLESENQQIRSELDNVNELNNNKVKVQIDLRSKNENLRYTRLQYQEAQNYIAQLQIDIEDLHKQKEKFKSECLQFQKKYQSENENFTQLNVQQLALEQSHKNLEKQNSELKNELQILKRQQVEAIDQIDMLSRDSEVFRRNYDLLSQQNQELIDELERFHLQEEQQSITRSSKLKELKSKLSQAQKQTNQDILYQSSSPKRTGLKAKGRYE